MFSHITSNILQKIFSTSFCHQVSGHCSVGELVVVNKFLVSSTTMFLYSFSTSSYLISWKENGFRFVFSKGEYIIIVKFSWMKSGFSSAYFVLCCWSLSLCLCECPVFYCSITNPVVCSLSPSHAFVYSTGKTSIGAFSGMMLLSLLRDNFAFEKKNAQKNTPPPLKSYKHSDGPSVIQDSIYSGSGLCRELLLLDFNWCKCYFSLDFWSECLMKVSVHPAHSSSSLHRFKWTKMSLL